MRFDRWCWQWRMHDRFSVARPNLRRRDHDYDPINGQLHRLPTVRDFRRGGATRLASIRGAAAARYFRAAGQPGAAVPTWASGPAAEKQEHAVLFRQQFTMLAYGTLRRLPPEKWEYHLAGEEKETAVDTGKGARPLLVTEHTPSGVSGLPHCNRGLLWAD